MEHMSSSINAEALQMIASIYNNKRLIADAISAKSLSADAISSNKVCIGGECLTASEITKLKRFLSVPLSSINAIKQVTYTQGRITTNKPIHIKQNALYVTGWAGFGSKNEMKPYPDLTSRYGGANENGKSYNASKGRGGVLHILH